MKTYIATEKLKEAKFRGQKALVVEALLSFNEPKAVEEVEKTANHGGRYSKLLNEWAMENGGVHGSVLYHLRELEKAKLIKVEGEADTMKVVKKTTKAKKATGKKAPKKVAAPEEVEEPMPVAS